MQTTITFTVQVEGDDQSVLNAIQVIAKELQEKVGETVANEYHKADGKLSIHCDYHDDCGGDMLIHPHD